MPGDMAHVNSRLEELWAIVSAIPPGQVRGYGEVGRELTHPVSGLLIGRWMAQAPEGVPWWRVVGADGSIKTFKRGPEHGIRQRKLLEDEGVGFVGDAVNPESWFQG